MPRRTSRCPVRLIAIGDGAGNSVNFTLDALGNVTHTAWSNPDNSTARSRSATFDALGCLQAASVWNVV